jgi:hypothetical protein
MTARLAPPLRWFTVLFAVLALTLGITGAATAPAAHAATVNCGTSHPYAGSWQAYDPKGRVTNIHITFADCNKYNTATVYVVGHSFLNQSRQPIYWGTPSSVTWGYVGTSLTVTYRFNGLTEKLFIRPAQKYTGLPVTETQYFPSSGTSHTFPRQYFHRV